MVESSVYGHRSPELKNKKDENLHQLLHNNISILNLNPKRSKKLIKTKKSGVKTNHLPKKYMQDQIDELLQINQLINMSVVNGDFNKTISLIHKSNLIYEFLYYINKLNALDEESEIIKNLLKNNFRLCLIIKYQDIVQEVSQIELKEHNDIIFDRISIILDFLDYQILTLSSERFTPFIPDLNSIETEMKSIDELISIINNHNNIMEKYDDLISILNLKNSLNNKKIYQMFIDEISDIILEIEFGPNITAAKNKNEVFSMISSIKSVLSKKYRILLRSILDEKQILQKKSFEIKSSETCIFCQNEISLGAKICPFCGSIQ